MIKRIELVLSPEEAANEAGHKKLISKAARIPESDLLAIVLKRRSIDARSRSPRIVLTYELITRPDEIPEPTTLPDYKEVSNATPVHIIGCGPAGLFAALRLLELGFKPVIIERGKDVRERRRDLAILNRNRVVNPHSNYCFGEGGAGTYSDGKLYTRSDKRGNVKGVLDTLIRFGASASIAIDAHPHIGTNKLPAVISEIRNLILQQGGEIHFNTHFTGLSFNTEGVKQMHLQPSTGGQSFNVPVKAVILATGHSARDVFETLHNSGIEVECKPFALGVRIEHPQSIIDKIQYHCDIRNPLLPASSYALSAQANGRGVYSFCMCPGGIIAAAATSPGEIVVNGWSPSKRNNPFANSGMVVSVDDDDFKPYAAAGPLRAMKFQSAIEQKAFEAGGGDLKAPAQRLMDFLDNKLQPSLPTCSYTPGIVPVKIDEVLPVAVVNSLREGLLSMGKKMKGYLTNEAVLVATESRTSSPVRIPRDPTTLMHPQVSGLFPCGEGAGYAGGIMSAAMDGERCAEGVFRFLTNYR